MFRRLPMITLLLALAVAAVQARPRVGLVLGGGGARGAAHIGILEQLQAQHVPVDCIAGTCFGALVAGAWAAGVSTAQMRRAMAEADWKDMFQDNPSLSETGHLNKMLLQRFLPGSEAGVGPGGLHYPPGVVSGQKVGLFIKRLVRADRGEPEIADLPLPLAIVATDLGSGAKVVFRDGSLTQAMRASMAVPGLMAPVLVDGRPLVDGGLVDNVPIDEVRALCDPEVVIAVNVGTPLLPATGIGSLLSVTTQMVALLTEQNVSRSLLLLRPGDIYLRPVLGDIGATDFARFDAAAAQGRQAARWIADALAVLAVDEATWQRRQQARMGQEKAVATVDEVRIEGLQRVNPAAVARHISQRTGRPLDTAALERDLLRVYGDGWYEHVDYSLVSDQGRDVLIVRPVEKRWGPDYLRFALNLEASVDQGSAFGLRAGYQRTWLNRLGGSLLARAELGSRSGLALRWHQPLDAPQRWFADVEASAQVRHADLYVGNERAAQYELSRTGLALTLGGRVGLLGKWALGWSAATNRLEIDTGVGTGSSGQEELQGATALIDLEQFDRLYFPTRGWSATAALFRSRRGDFTRAQIDLRAALPWRDVVFGARYSYTGSPSGRLPLEVADTLGGFLNLSAYPSGRVIADTVRYAHLRAEWILGRLPLGLRGDLRLGLALEGASFGNSYIGSDGAGRFDSATVYFGGETPFGPVYIGVAGSSQGHGNAYLFLGTP